MTIGQVAKETNISPSAIRFYESAGLLPAPLRKNGVRDYDESIVARLKLLQFLRSGGVSVRSLAASDRHAAAERRIVEIDGLIEELVAMKARLQSLLDCDCDGDTNKCVVYA